MTLRNRPTTPDSCSRPVMGMPVSGEPGAGESRDRSRARSVRSGCGSALLLRSDLFGWARYFDQGDLADVRWFSRKKPASGDATRAAPVPGVFVYVLQVGDTESNRTVSSELLDQLVRAAKESALSALDRRFRTESWCSEIRTHASRQGPCAYFSLTITVQPGETQASMQDRVGREFIRRWDAADAADHRSCGSCGGQPDRDDPVLICPACGTPSVIVATSIAWKALHDGIQSRACAACEQVTIVVDPTMACGRCEQLRPDINEQLRSRFESFGPGDPADAPCVGCGFFPQGAPPSPWIHQVFDCLHCGMEISVAENAFIPGQAMHVRCGRCSRDTEIPRSIWCPKCGQRIRKEGVAAHLREISGQG